MIFRLPRKPNCSVCAASRTWLVFVIQHAFSPRSIVCIFCCASNRYWKLLLACVRYEMSWRLINEMMQWTKMLKNGGNLFRFVDEIRWLRWREKFNFECKWKNRLLIIIVQLSFASQNMLMYHFQKNLKASSQNTTPRSFCFDSISNINEGERNKL